MSADLTLPGDISGLRRLCSPVYSPRDELHGVVVGSPHGRSLMLYAPTEGDGNLHYLDESYGLCLEDATGRAHAAWWLAESLRRDKRRKAPLCPSWFVTGIDRSFWRLMHGSDSWESHQFGYAERGAPPFRIVPSLADLDPNDPRLLADGSRWVDAEALRRVVLHVAGRDDVR